LKPPDHKSVAVHPWVFLVLVLPFGAVSGYVSVALAYGLSQAGWNTAKVGVLLGLYSLPLIGNLLWAPFVDTLLTVRRWYLIGSAATAIAVLLLALLSGERVSMGWLDALVLITACANSLLGVAMTALMAHGTAPDQKGRASGWMMAGNFAGGGLGGGATLWLAQRVSASWVPGAALGLCIALCCLVLPLTSAPGPLLQSHVLLVRFKGVAHDVWSVVKVRGGYLALLISFLPIGNGAMSALFAPFAKEWHASADTVALTTGALTGVLSGLGCLAGGWLCDRFDRKSLYVLFGITEALCAGAMALGPRTESAYALYTLLYGLCSGLCFAAFGAVALEAIGRGAAASKYNLYSSLANAPITYVTFLASAAFTRWGSNGSLYTEPVLAAASVAVFLFAVHISAGHGRATPATAG
jgi:PAT family beta-lactamase induction signal transducer AmpG